MSGLPKGWVETTIGEVCNYIQRGKSPKYVERSKLPVINQKCVRWAGIDERYLKYVDPEQWSSWTEERFLVPDDVLWNSTGTGTIGRAALFKGLQTADRAVVDSHVTILRTNGAVTGTFLHRFIQSPGVQAAIIDMQSGTTNQVELNRAEIIATALPLPPLAEQKRIVAKLEALNAKSARARTALARIETLVSRYKQAVLSKAFSGELTNGDTSTDWHTVRLEEIAEIGTGATPKRGNAEYYSNGTIPWITSGAVNEGLILQADEFITERAIQETNCKIFPAGTLVVAMYGEGKTRGKVAILGLDAATNQALAAVRIRSSEVSAPQYVYLFLQSVYLTLREEAAGGVQPNLNLSIVKAIELPLPLLEEQHEIVRRIESAFAKIDRLAAEAKRALALVGRLDEAVLAKAFRGELVPQDENDEPAATLLARIRTEREAAPKVKRGRKARS
ncbi:restriction endonuclease subunit S [Pannonibacter phragmitetus]|uniref:restriction endonuclease subunit S n=1 Tax=Pannonibacter phragmitetus TaxID=121719 RepID=UPI000B965A54|nr:restriction endonuclease subunit S [Pannonibacter phragmitetus]